jgi:hypothetical protein
LVLGEKGIQPLTRIKTKSFRSKTIADKHTTVLKNVIPFNSILFNIHILMTEANYLTTMFHKIYVGNSEDHRLYGKINAPNSNESLVSTSFRAVNKTEDIVLSAWKEPHPAWKFYHHRYEINCSSAFFEKRMEGLKIIFNNKELTILYVYSPYLISVNDSNLQIEEGKVIVQTCFNDFKEFVVTSTYMEFGDFSDRQYPWMSTLPFKPST